MEHIENCEMIKAEIVNGTRLEMKFYDQQNDVLRTVKFNKQNYDRERGQFVDDPEKAQYYMSLYRDGMSGVKLYTRKNVDTKFNDVTRWA